MRAIIIVAIGSRTGRYGGPFEIAKRQVILSRIAGVDSTLWAGYLPHDGPDQETLPSGTVLVPVHSLSRAGRFSLVVSIRAIISLWRQSSSAAVVHVSFGRELIPILAASFALIHRRRLVIQPHGMLTSRTSLMHSVADLLVRPLVRRADVLVALTSHEKKALREWLGAAGDSTRIVILGNPVAPHAIASLRQRPVSTRVLFAARLHPRKRVHDFIAAAECAQFLGLSGMYEIYGPDGGDLAEVAKAASCYQNLSYKGAVRADELTSVVDKSAIFVLTSEREPWGDVLALALSLGVPAIVTSSSALSEVITEYGAGIVVNDGESAEIARNVHDLLTDPRLYAECSAGALKLSSALFSNKTQIEQLYSLYQSTSCDRGLAQ